MEKGFFITGTDTGVGKTFVAAGLIRAMKDIGLSVCPMKPVETGCRMKEGVLTPVDAVKLKNTADVNIPIDAINPYRFKSPLAPAVAAGLEKMTIDRNRIISTYKKLEKKYDVIFVEGAGGVMVPLKEKYFFVDLAKDLRLPLLIVARQGLGTINHSLLTIEAARARGLNITGLIFNQAEDTKADVSKKTNPEVIARTSGVPVLGFIPYLSGKDKRKSTELFNGIADRLI